MHHWVSLFCTSHSNLARTSFARFGIQFGSGHKVGPKNRIIVRLHTICIACGVLRERTRTVENCRVFHLGIETCRPNSWPPASQSDPHNFFTPGTSLYLHLHFSIHFYICSRTKVRAIASKNPSVISHSSSFRRSRPLGQTTMMTPFKLPGAHQSFFSQLVWSRQACDLVSTVD